MDHSNQDSEYRNRRRGWRDLRSRQVDVQADAVARSELEVEELNAVSPWHLLVVMPERIEKH